MRKRNAHKKEVPRQRITPRPVFNKQLSKFFSNFKYLKSIFRPTQDEKEEAKPIGIYYEI
jgi:hypothetical protein